MFASIQPIPIERADLPKLPSNWQWVRFADICERVSVGHVGPTTEFFRDRANGICFLRSQNVRPGRIDLETATAIAPEFHQKLKKSKLQSGDILFVRVGANRGDCCVVPDGVGELNCANIVFARPKHTTGFHGYFFQSELGRNLLLSASVGAAQGVINTSSVASMPVPFPPLPVQKRIAEILSAYDDMIENCQRRIKILEQMARGLYREWFVKFRFPNHAKTPMVDSPLGKIPKGWEVKTVPQCVHINPPVKVPRDGKKAFVPMGCLSNNSMLISDIEDREGNSGSKFQNGDTLFARITPCLENGKTGYVQFLPDADAVAFGSTEFIVLRSRTLTPEFVYCLARSDDFRGVAIKSMSGATGRQRVQEHCFADFKIVQPHQILLEQFTAIVAPSFRLIYSFQRKIQNLRKTRDLLLPRLMSGQVKLETEAI